MSNPSLLEGFYELLRQPQVGNGEAVLGGLFAVGSGGVVVVLDVVGEASEVFECLLAENRVGRGDCAGAVPGDSQRREGVV